MSIVIVYPGMAGELVRARETFFASAVSAGKRLLAGVGADVASLGGGLGEMVDWRGRVGKVPDARAC